MTTKPRPSIIDRKSEILAVTLDLAFSIGPDNVTTGQIAGQLGISQPAIYKHYSGKEIIWNAVGKMLSDRISENLQSDGQSSGSPLAEIRRLVLVHLELISKFPALPEIMVIRDPSSAIRGARSQMQSAMTTYQQALAREFLNAQNMGQLPNTMKPDDYLGLLFGVIQGVVLRTIVSHDPALLLRDGERLLDLQLSLFTTQSGKS